MTSTGWIDSRALGAAAGAAARTGVAVMIDSSIGADGSTPTRHSGTSAIIAGSATTHASVAAMTTWRIA